MPSAESGLSRPLYVSDLDGTLLRPDQALSPRTISVVNDLTSAGVLFTYATARSFTSASRVTAALRLEVPVVTYGGAVIVDPRSGQPRPATMMPPRAVTALQRASTTHAVQPVVFAMHLGADRIGWLRAGASAHVEAFLARRPGDPRLLPLDSWDAIDPASVFYISVIADHRALLQLRDHLADDLDGCHVLLSEDIYTSGEYWLEVSSTAATKAASIITLRDELGAGRLVCFGDNHNDLTMFAVADHAVAVANAEPAALRAADEIIGPNTGDAVAEWLMRHNRCSRLAAGAGAAGLSVTLGAPQGQPGTQRTVSVVFTNTSGASCTMYGYPGANLVQATSDQWRHHPLTYIGPVTAGQ